MIGYFFNRDKKFSEEVMYVPKNLIVIEDEEGLDINYFPNNLKAFDELWKYERTRVLGDFKYSVIDIFDVPDIYLKNFQDCCFTGDHVSAHILAIEIFQSTKQAVFEFRKNGN